MSKRNKRGALVGLTSVLAGFVLYFAFKEGCKYYRRKKYGRFSVFD